MKVAGWKMPRRLVKEIQWLSLKCLLEGQGSVRTVSREAGSGGFHFCILSSALLVLVLVDTSFALYLYLASATCPGLVPSRSPTLPSLVGWLTLVQDTPA